MVGDVLAFLRFHGTAHIQVARSGPELLDLCPCLRRGLRRVLCDRGRVLQEFQTHLTGEPEEVGIGAKLLQELRFTLAVIAKDRGDQQVARVLVLVEGGSKVLTSFIEQKLADKVIICIAPIISGEGTDAIGDLGIKEISRALKFYKSKFSELGPDIIFTGYPKWK